jgi:hypothetical protein
VPLFARLALMRDSADKARNAGPAGSNSILEAATQREACLLQLVHIFVPLGLHLALPDLLRVTEQKEGAVCAARCLIYNLWTLLIALEAKILL